MKKYIFTLKKIGYWYDDDIDSKWPNPSYFVDASWDLKIKNKVIKYLNLKFSCCGFFGHSFCRFRCSNSDCGCMEYCDGHYIWPEGLSHYLEVHNIRLPDDFVLHVLKKLKWLRIFPFLIIWKKLWGHIIWFLAMLRIVYIDDHWWISTKPFTNKKLVVSFNTPPILSYWRIQKFKPKKVVASYFKKHLNRNSKKFWVDLLKKHDINTSYKRINMIIKDSYWLIDMKKRVYAVEIKGKIIIIYELDQNELIKDSYHIRMNEFYALQESTKK